MLRTILVLIIAATVTPLVPAQDHGVKLPPGFKISLYADHELANDIYCMTLDSQGRVVVSSRGWVKRLEDTDGDGKADKAIELAKTATGAMGLCFDGDQLYICADGWFSNVTKNQKIVPLAFGEHGGHAMRKGPDGRFYIIYGNNSQIEKVKLDLSSPIQKPEAGGILRFSKDLKKVECIAHGFRNPYDFDFTPLGDIITYDSDTERDFLLPWYSPTRIYHVGHGQHHGWRLPGHLQSLARRDYYPDTEDILAPIGRGSPTGVVCYRHYQFPKRYHGGVFALDWTFGKIWFLPLEADGSSYKGKPELFLEPEGGNGFAPTDACVAPDGSLFVSIGGRGTRGAVYRIEYVGTKELPVVKWVEPESDRDKVLDAPQPLDAWSRSKWEPIARRGFTLTDTILNEKHTAARRSRAIEIITDLSPGLSIDEAEKVSRSDTWQVRARVAWSLGRDLPIGVEKVLLKLALDPHPRVRVEALAALGDLLVKRLPDKQLRDRFSQSQLSMEQQKGFLPVLVDNLGHSDKRVRMAVCRLIQSFAHPVDLWSALRDGKPLALLHFHLTQYWSSRERSFGRGRAEELTNIAQVLRVEDRTNWLVALRLLMLLDGDWCLHNPPQVVYSAYAFQKPPKERLDIEKEIHAHLRKIYPSGDANFDQEAARYFAMIEDDDPATVDKVLGRISNGSTAKDDVHHLIVLARLKGKRAPGQTAAIVDALFNLEKKWAGYQQKIKQTWAARLMEVVADLAKRHPDLGEAMLKHPGFVNPSHVIFTTTFNAEQRKQAALMFRGAVEKDPEYLWSPELIDLLASLPAAEYKPLFRKHWSDYSLREAMLKHLVATPEAEDRTRFLDGLDSGQKETLLASLAALDKLPPDASATHLVPILRRLRLSLLEPKEKDLRTKLLASFNRQAKTAITIAETATDPRSLAQAYEPVFASFTKQHPAEAKLLEGGNDDSTQVKKQLAEAAWEKGDAIRGLKLFQQRSCATCHSGSSRIGPDLTGSAGRFSRDDLFTAIIDPSRDVASAYRVDEIDTQDGKHFSGIVVFESADGVIVQLDAVKTVRIDSGNLASRQPGRKSLMPAGLLKDLKPDDLADLYAYLKSLKSGP